MKYEGLQNDFNAIRRDEVYQSALTKVLDEAQNYIEFLEGTETQHQALIEVLNDIDKAEKEFTKAELFKMFDAVLKK